MLLVRGGGGDSPEAVERKKQQYGVWMQELTERGKYIGGEPLTMDEGRMVHPDRSVNTDGPFIEGKEVIGGYVMFYADSMDEATEVAKTCPLLDGCDLEVRKVWSM